MSRIRIAAISLTAAVMCAAAAATAAAQNTFNRVVQSACPIKDQPAFHQCALDRMKTFRAARTLDGKPDLNGLWLRTRVAQDIEEHAGEGILGIPPEKTMVVDPPDGKIPYQPWGWARRKEYLDKYISPTTFCHPSGVRYIYFGDTEILQQPGAVVMFQPRFHQHRIIPINPAGPRLSPQVRLWDGDPRGRWEGETLVVELTNFNGMSTFDHAMNFASPEVRITERFTMIDPDTIHWEATIEDPKVFTRPWKMVLGLARSKATGYDREPWEDSCHEGSMQVGDLAPYFRAGYTKFPGVTLPE